MPRFAITNPYLIIVACLIVAVVGATAVARMPVDMFPAINMPQVVVATFYNGMPPEEIETEITGRFERFFTLGSGIDHMESRSLPGVSLIKIYFQPGTDANSDVAMVSNLAMANLRRLPPGTLPPVVLKFDASSLPVALVPLKGKGLSETVLRDTAQFAVRNQIANVPGATIPPPFGGKYRQIMVYVDPLRLEAHQLSLMDVVRSLNTSNLILPAGDVKIGPIDYNIYTNSQLASVSDINQVPIKTVGQTTVSVADVGRAEDGHQTQYNIVRVDGQRSVYLPIMKQGGDTNTIAVVDGLKSALSRLVDVPKQLVTRVVFDQSLFVKRAIQTLLAEGIVGLLLTGLMIPVFLGSTRATIAVLLSVPLSVLAAFVVLYFGGSSINTMILGGLALGFSRLIFNSVIVLENIFRYLEKGEDPAVAAEQGGREVAMPVLACTLTTAVVFFPVTFLYGVSRFLFSALALAVMLSLAASYFVAFTVVPLFCARLLARRAAASAAAAPATAEASQPLTPSRPPNRLFTRFQDFFRALVEKYEALVRRGLQRPWALIAAMAILFAASLFLYPFLGVAFFPRTDAGQFVINLKTQPGTNVNVTDEQVERVRQIVRSVIPPDDLRIVVSNVGVTPGFSAIYTSNSAPHTGFLQVELNEKHKEPTFVYMQRVRSRIREQMPNLSAYLQLGGLAEAVLNLGMPAPIDVQVSGSDQEADYRVATELADRIRGVRGVSDLLIPQDLDYPALKLAVDRTRSAELGLTQREVVHNVVTALTSNAMIAPSYWVDPKSGNDYMLTVQYPETQVNSLLDLRSIPLRGEGQARTVRLDTVSRLSHMNSPTEVDHYQIRRVIDIYVSPASEDLGRVAAQIDRIVATTHLPSGVRIDLRGMVQGMRASFRSFAFGLALAVLLLYLILVAPFRSFLDPFLVLLAVPPGVSGVLITLWLSGTTLNVMSLMGVVMMVGIVASNSILIIEFAHRLRADGLPVGEAIVQACRVRLRPILITSLATVVGLLPMALKVGTGSEAYAPLAQAIIGGLLVSGLLTMFAVPAAYLLAYRRRAA